MMRHVMLSRDKCDKIIHRQLTTLQLTQQTTLNMHTSDILLGLLAVFCPPLVVWMKSGLCNADFLLNLVLCCLAYLPGLVHAWYIIAERSTCEAPVDAERGMLGPSSVRKHRSYGTAGPARSGRAGSGASAVQAQAQTQPRTNGREQYDEPPPSYANVVAGERPKTRT
jgi:uncharacterized membrane protein YqaE (UPF0057 family)